MAAEMLWQFGIYKNGSFTAGATAHWFMDPYWTESGFNGERPCIAVTNPENSPRILKSFQFSLINGSSDGESFTSSSGTPYQTYASKATITANVGSVSSNEVQVDSANGRFHHSDLAGQSYWGSRPTNAKGDKENPDAPEDGYPIFYTFIFNKGISIPANGTVYILFKATWNTAGTHLIQIYPVKGIVIPVYHSVTWNPNGGNWAGSTANIVQDVEDGKSATKPSDPTRTAYRFTGWSPNNTAYTNCTSDLVYTAQWQVKSGKVTFYRNYSDSDMEVVSGGEISDVDYSTSTLGSIKPVNPTRQDMYIFKGWSLSRHGNLEQDSKLLWDEAGDKAIDTFYAIWEKIYTVWVRENGVWVKKLNVRKYNAATKTWDELPPKQRAKGSWDDKL